jgi:hypothetical protein
MCFSLKNKFNEINHKIDMKVKKDYQTIISPLLQSKIYQGRQSSCPALAKLKVLPGSLTDLSA